MGRACPGVVVGDVADDDVVAGGHVFDGEGAGAAGFEVGVAGFADVGVFADFVGAGVDGGGWVAGVVDGDLVVGDVGLEDDGFVDDGAVVLDDEGDVAGGDGAGESVRVIGPAPLVSPSATFTVVVGLVTVSAARMPMA